jgi:dicarboxylate/amino acid:cation (Na+ or H+) symporter, DAACS family
MPKSRSLIVGLLAGAALGLAIEHFSTDVPSLKLLVTYALEPLGKMFVRLLLMLVIPIVFSALVMGIVELDLRQLRRIGLRMLAYTVSVSAIAASIGLLLVNWLRPGDGFPDALRAGMGAAPAPTLSGSASALDLIIAIVPQNPVAAASNGDMIAVIFASAFFGVALAQVETPGAEALKRGIQGLLDVSMRLIELVLKLAPVGVFALMSTATARLGFDVLLQLGSYVFVVLLGLSIHMFGVYSLLLRWLAQRSPIQFFRDIRLALVTAFSTSSSSATLSTALRVADENLGLPKHVSRFVLTAGATMNQNGTALFEGVTVLFLAQAYGVELGFREQAIVMLICVLAGIGTAGVPAGSLPVIATILSLVGVPPEAVGLIIGVDRILDMSRTTVNVAGDLAAAAYVASTDAGVLEETRAEPE